MTARIRPTAKSPLVDAVLEGRFSRRAFAALAAAGTLTLAGCGLDDAGVAQEPSQQSQQGSEPEPTQSEVASTEEPVALSAFVLNTLCTVTAYGVGEETVRSCLELCFHYEDLFSARRDSSDVARLNAASGEPVELDPDTADLLARSLELAEASEGAFDPTVGTVSLLWDFSEGIKPADEQIGDALPHIGWQGLHLDGTLAWMDDPLAKVDLGGIAKGWICARLAETLADAGCSSALVNLGTSSIAAVGTKPDGSNWRVGLRDPLDSMASIAAVVEVADECVTSSGLYDRQFELDGVSYWHILDPATGYPVKTDVLGDTVICSDPVVGDALSTVLFVKGSEAGAEWVERRRPDVAAHFVCEDGSEVFANGFEGRGYEPVAR